MLGHNSKVALFEITYYKIEIRRRNKDCWCTLYVEGEFWADRLDQLDVNPEEKAQQGKVIETFRVEATDSDLE